MPALLIFGGGYTGNAIAASATGYDVTIAHRDTDAAPSIATATHIVSTAPPGPAGDPILARYAAALRAAPRLRWLCYLSTTGVYGNRDGAWVDEHTTPAPTAPRSVLRLAAERAWHDCAAGRPLDLFRLAGIYGPGRSVLNELRAGTARQVVAPEHCFGRIHLDDIAGAVLAAAARPAPGTRVLHGNDNLPAPSAEVVVEAARLLGIAPPPPRTLNQAWPDMSPMARGFWSENRRVASALTQQWLARRWLYPTYREGLAAILAAS